MYSDNSAQTARTTTSSSWTSTPPAAANLPPTNTLLIDTNVSSWPRKSAAFALAHAWHGCLDVAALNAGIDDRDCIFHALGPAGPRTSPALPPTKPNLHTFSVDLLGVYSGIKLFVHYASLPLACQIVPRRRDRRDLYALPVIPQYTATKHALVGLVRALAPQATTHNFTINAVCPDMVPTGLAPPGLMEA
ncbi:hypothetical protein B0H14DRAFT_2527845 [Mycena olivaceomarginata]|nr:hypothetical protein B0H14DRAFT_2527845 [Mycena olivaceomarginata]